MPGRITRGAHDREFVIIANSAVRDERLTWKARGLLAYLLSKPDDWTVMQAELERAGPDGRAAVRSGLAELEELGYLIRTVRNTRAGAHVTSEVVEEPGGGFARGAHPLRETGLYELPTNEITRGRKPAQGSLLDDDQQPSAWLVAAARARAEAVPMPPGFRDRIRDRRTEIES